MMGKTLGHYEITSQLGKGGMGEVYQAKDSKLGRSVAIKVLPEEFAKDADRVARFQREAKLLASLNHPNIAAIHGLEESGGTNFLVLELVEGETLAGRIKKGPIPVEESLKLALQISEALEAAHEKGVIHRDLKPANIKVTPDGRVKILDFGLAKAYAGDKDEINPSNSPTLSDAATRQGVILGTAAYMSPEQARGDAVDRKADIWAFGVVLFEMLTGRPMFEGRTVSDTLAAVLMREPEWQRLPSNLHPRIRLLLERCLEKEPKNRCSGIGDARAEIQKALADPGGVLVPGIVAEHRIMIRTTLLWVAAAIVLTAIIAGVAVWKLKPHEPRQLIRFTYELPETQQLIQGINGDFFLAVSPDSTQFVYGTTEGLYLRSMGALDARLIAGTDKNSIGPFFSPDGQWVGYWSRSEFKLKKVALSGGAPVVLCDTSPGVLGASWASDNTIVYSDQRSGVMRISADGGTPKLLIKANFENLKDGFPAFPQMLPDRKNLLFTAISSGNVFRLFDSDNMRIVVQSLESGEQRVVLKSGSGAVYLSTGHLVYGLTNNRTNNSVVNLFACAFDLEKLEIKGGPISMLEGVRRGISFSDSGTLVYLPGTSTNLSTLVWVDRNGKEEAIAAPPNDYRAPRISPDGSKLALVVSSGANKSDISIWDIPREIMTRLTLNETSGVPLWTSDGQRIVFWSAPANSFGIYSKSSDGAGGDEKLISAQDHLFYPWSWSRDGKTLLLSDFALSGGAATNIGALSMEAGHKWKPLLTEKYTENEPQISPDGKWMAYISNESGQFEVYVRPFPDVNNGRHQVSKSGGQQPLWSPDGRELFYRNEDAVISVAVRTEPKFDAGKPEVLFQGKYILRSSGNVRPWDISPDGKRFLMMKSLGTSYAGAGPRKINVVLNWFEELKQRVPAR